MRKRFRHTLVYTTLRPFFRVFLFLKFGYRSKKFKPPRDVKGPYLIVSNHALAMDPFLLAMSFREPIFYVASDMIFSIPTWSKVIRYLVSPIPKTKYRSDMETVRDIIKMVKSGGSVAVFPEGNSTFHGKLMPIDPSIVKLVRLLKIPLVLYRLEGGYLNKPRWAKKTRRGKALGQVMRLITPEEAASMDNDQLYKAMIEAIDADPYAFQASKKARYRHKTLAEDIESAYSLCPSCGSFETLTSQKDIVGCSACDFNARFTPAGTLEKLSGKTHFETTTPWYHAQEKAIAGRVKKGGLIFEDKNEAVLDARRGTEKIPLGAADIKLYPDCIDIAFHDQEPLSIPIDDVRASVQQKNKLIVYDKRTKTTYYLLNHRKRNALKYVQAIDAIQKGVE